MSAVRSFWKIKERRWAYFACLGRLRFAYQAIDMAYRNPDMTQAVRDAARKASQSLDELIREINKGVPDSAPGKSRKENP